MNGATYRLGPFDVARLPAIRFGPGRSAELPEIVAALGRRVLLVTGARSFRTSRRWPDLLEGLAAGEIGVETAAIEGEPSPDGVDAIVARHRAAPIDVVVGIGGGSVLDAAKAVAGLLRTGTSAMDHLEGVGRGVPYPGPSVPFVAVPTTAGTGSEATKNAVLSRRGPDGFKKSFRDERLVARVALVDPDLLAGLRPELIATNGLDALTQLLESYVSTRAGAFTDALALAGLAAARDGLGSWFEAATAGDEAPSARAAMAFAALASGITLAQTGLGAAHGLASPLGARFPIPHGAACGATVAAATEVNVRALESREPGGSGLRRYAEAGRVLSGRPGLDDSAARAALVAALHELAARLRTGGLAAYGVGESDVAWLVAQARGTSMRTNAVVLTDDEIGEIVRRSL